MFSRRHCPQVPAGQSQTTAPDPRVNAVPPLLQATQVTGSDSGGRLPWWARGAASVAGCGTCGCELTTEPALRPRAATRAVANAERSGRAEGSRLSGFACCAVRFRVRRIAALAAVTSHIVRRARTDYFRHCWDCRCWDCRCWDCRCWDCRCWDCHCWDCHRDDQCRLPPRLVLGLGHRLWRYCKRLRRSRAR